MASGTFAIPTSYQKTTHSVQKSKLETKNVRSEDELLKFFLHGSYDVQRGNVHASSIEENSDQILNTKDETQTISNINPDDKKSKSRCMFEETYMINISVKQPHTKPSSTKQIDVRIEKTPSDIPITNDKLDDDEISSIFDEEDNDEVDSVIFNEINSTSSSTTDMSSKKLTLADMINKTLTTIPTTSSDNINNKNPNWFIDQQCQIKTQTINKDIPSSSKNIEKVNKTPPPSVSSIPSSTLTSNISEDEKLFEYLDYLETKEESNQSPIKSSNSSTATKPLRSTPSNNKIPLKQQQQESIPIIDLEQLCRSLTVNDLKDELIRKKIYELKILIDERHKKQKSQIPLIKPRKDNLPILIAMPPVIQQRRRTTNPQSTSLIQSKTIHSQLPYYHNINQQYPQYQISSINTNRKYQYT